MSYPLTSESAVLIEDAPSLFHLDRRRDVRHPVMGHVTAWRYQNNLPSAHEPGCTLRLRNLSGGGLAAWTDRPFSPEEPLMVNFPAHGPDGSLEMTGHVVRCRPTDSGYELAIQFDLPSAA